MFIILGVGVLLLPIALVSCLGASCQAPSSSAAPRTYTVAKGYALVVGVELVEGQTGIDAGTQGSGRDAKAIYSILQQRGFDQANMHLLITQQARADSVKSIMYRIASSMAPADLFVLYFSGHGKQVSDQGKLDEVDDHMDETIRCFDRDLIDDTLLLAFQQMPAGSRIVYINDACNSGTSYKFFKGASFNNTKAAEHGFSLEDAEPFIVPNESLDSEQFNDTLAAQLIYLGGSRDGEFAHGWPTGGEFTLALQRALSLPYLSQNYFELYKQVNNMVRRWQIPTYAEMGPVEDSFRKQTPFTIKPQ
jgi:hypothetical protein